MSNLGTVAWATYLLGIVSAVAFLAVYLVGIRFWRRRPPLEEPATVRARRFILTLTFALLLRYVTGVFNLVATSGHPADSPPAFLGGVLSVVVQLWLLWLLIQERREAQKEDETR